MFDSIEFSGDAFSEQQPEGNQEINEIEYDEVESEIYDDDENDEKLVSLEDFKDISIITVDWNVMTIISSIEGEKIIIDPDFQRRSAWNNKTKSKFIESLILGIPVPGVLLGQGVDKKNEFLVVDGKQRLLTLYQFCKGDFRKGLTSKYKGFKLQKLKVLEELNGCSYSDLVKNHPEFSQLLDFATIRTTTLKNLPKKEAFYEVFNRLNTGSKTLSPQELRNSLFPGEFLSYINNLMKEDGNAIHRALNIRSEHNRMKDNELLIRGIAFATRLSEYDNSTSGFLDSTVEFYNSLIKDDSNQVHEIVENVLKSIDFCLSKFGDKPFVLHGLEERSRKFNRNVFDLFIHFTHTDYQRSVVISNDIYYPDLVSNLLLNNPAFFEAVTVNTHSTSSVRIKFKIFEDELIRRGMKIDESIFKY